MVDGEPRIHLWQFACSTHGSVNRHMLCFRSMGLVWRSTDEGKTRSFFPILRTSCPRCALFSFIEWLDRWTSGEGAHYDFYELDDDGEWEVVV